MTRTTALPSLVAATVVSLLPACSEKESASPVVMEAKAVVGQPKALATKLEAVAKEAKASDSTLAKLVPDGTAIYVQAPSVDRLATSLRDLTSVFAPDGQAVDIDEVLAELPGSTKDLDRSKPLGICLVLGPQPGSEPMPTLLVPTTSPESFVRAVTETGMGFSTTIHGNYVSVSMGPPAQPGSAPAAIASDLPAGDIVARLDLQRLVAHFRPVIDAGLAEMTSAMDSMPPEATAGMDMGAFMKLYVGGARSIVDAGQTLDLALRLDGSVVELASEFTAREGSVLDGFGSGETTDAMALARYLDPDATMCAVLGMDQKAMLDRMRPLIDAAFTMYPEPLRSSFQKMMGSADELAAELGSAMCMNADVGGEGMRNTLYLQPRDPAKLVEIYRTMLVSVPGITFDELKEGEVKGVKVLRSRMHVDMEALTGEQMDALGEEQKAQMKAMFDRMYGANGLAFTIATQGDVTAMVLGGDDAHLERALARLSSSSTVPPRLARGLKQVGDLNPCFALQYNLGALMQGMQDLLGDSGLPISFPKVSASFTVWGGVDGRTWHGAMSTDVKELGAAFRASMESMAVAGGAEKQLEAQTEITAIGSALDQFAAMNNGEYPDSLEALITPDTNGNAFLAHYSVMMDPWGRDYGYEAPSASRAKPRVYTYGRDGQPGGTGEDADLDDSDARR